MSAKFLKLDLCEKNVQVYLKLLKSIRMPFTMEVSNYTTKIISENYNIHFLKNLQSNRTFAAAAKLKSDVKKFVPPDVDMSKNIYHRVNFKGQEFKVKKVMNIDLNNCYATILKNAGYITDETFKYINSIPKKERLACLGMLASRKDIFYHNAAGAVIKMETAVNPLSDFFFFCVQETERIISDVKNIISTDKFLFSWVDGIYFNFESEGYGEILRDYIRDKFNVESKVEILTDFEVSIIGDSFYRVKFLNEKQKMKTFSIPLEETETKKSIVNYLLTKKYN